MKTVGIIAYIILGIWATFSFNTSNISLAMRYYVANLVAMPFKTIVASITILFLITGIFIITIKNFVLPISSQIKNIEPALKTFGEFNIKVDSLQATTGYIKIIERLNLNRSDIQKDQILKFIDDSRYLYSNYPTEFDKIPDFNSLYNLTETTQVTVVKIENLKKLFFSSITITSNLTKNISFIDMKHYQVERHS